MINENAQFLSKEQIDQHIARLDPKNFKSIDAEWEIAVLNALSKVGDVIHEPTLEGPAKLDVHLTTHAGDTFLADVATVSDEGFEDDSPYKDFYVELQQRLRAAGVLNNGWVLNVAAYPAKYGEPTRLAIPARSEFSAQIFNSNFKQFLKKVKENPHEVSNYSVSTEKTNIALMYDPSRNSFISHLPVYNAATIKDQNPVFNALRRKAKQLKRVSYDGPKGVLLCDGGTNMLHSQPHGSFEFNFNAADAAKDFLRQNQSIDFVLLFSSVWPSDRLYRPNAGGPTRRVQVTLIPNKNFGGLPESLKEVIQKLETQFPEPENTPTGARESIRHGYDSMKLRPFAGGWRVSETEIQISASAVFALLAGAVTQDELFKNLGFMPQSNDMSAIRNPFEYMLSQKMRIAEIKIEETPYDESKLVFRFDGPDPALSPFTNPKA